MTGKRDVLRRFRRAAHGAAAIEYAIALPLLMLMIMGAIWSGLLVFSVSSLEMAVEAAARCSAVDASHCGSVGAVQTYAQSQYGGPAISPVFNVSYSGCGHTVTGTATFNVNIVPGLYDIPLSVSACYP